MKKIYLFAVIFALIAGFSTYFFVNGLQHNSAITGVAESDVVIALQDIEPDTVIKSEMLKVVRLPESSITYGTAVKASDIEGWVVTEKIFKGEQVQVAKLAKLDENGGKGGLEYDDGYRLSYHLDKGHYAVTISVANTDAVGFFIRRGDYINIFLDNHLSTPVTENPLLRNVKVLELGTYADHKANAEGIETTNYDWITVSLTEAQIKKLLPYENEHSEGVHFLVALVPYAEGANITTLPEKTTVNENGETVTVPRVEEPVTNRGMGDIQAETTTTAPAK
ncbi:MAG: Flp pilus assembly protein CpaB [Clostridia bacterium]|nr:Flp pilus assembly protein CpaB [Clostridia bacterium]